MALIRHPSEPEEWALPGSGHEPGERLEETVRREVREETGLECELAAVDRVIRKRFVHEDDPARRPYLLTVFFEARQTGGEIDLEPSRWEPDEEIIDARWHSKPPGSVADLIDGFVADWNWPDE